MHTNGMIENRDNFAVKKTLFRGSRSLAIGTTFGLMAVGSVLAVVSRHLADSGQAGTVRYLGWCCLVAGGGALALWLLTKRS